MEKETAQEVFGFQTLEYKKEIVINKPKEYISKIIKDKMSERGVTCRGFQRISETTKFKKKMTLTGLYHITDYYSNYTIDNLLKLLEIFDLEIEIVPRK